MKIDQPGMRRSRHRLDLSLDLPEPITGARFKTGMAMKDRGHPAYPDLTIGIDLPKSVDQRQVIAHELIPVVGPVARVGIIQS